MNWEQLCNEAEYCGTFDSSGDWESDREEIEELVMDVGSRQEVKKLISYFDGVTILIVVERIDGVTRKFRWKKEAGK